jgi:hypothetical protein
MDRKEELKNRLLETLLAARLIVTINQLDTDDDSSVRLMFVLKKDIRLLFDL